MSEPLREIPAEIYIGDTATIAITDARFPASEGWSMELHFAGGERVTLAGSGSGSTHTFAIAADTFDTASVGGTDWTLLASRAVPQAERCVARTGRSTIKADPAAGGAAPGVVTTHAQRMLAAIETALEQRALSADQRSYTIDGRSLERMTPSELSAWRAVYRNQVRTEKILDAKGIDRAPMKVRSRFA